MKIWIDIDNSPHVPFFKPVIEKLTARGDSVLVSTRRYAQTLQLLDDAKIPYHCVGEHAGASRLKKVTNLISRAAQLRSLVKEFRPDRALSHGSRALSLCAWWMNIPSLLFFDYEWTEMQIFKRCADVLACPAVLPEDSLRSAGIPLEKIKRYHGLKEELYLPDFVPDPSFRAQLGIDEDSVMVTIRPSSMTSNYHDCRSEEILRELLMRAGRASQVRAIVTPRTQTDRNLVESVVATEGFTNIRVADRALPGMQLLYWSDLVISGGGTMNRESALLGTSTYSMFTGRRPSIDSYLSSINKLHFLESPSDLDAVQFTRHRRSADYRYNGSSVLDEIIQLIDAPTR